MSTKVKGDKIKEGSIPLSALADDVKDEFNGKYGLSGYCGTLGRDNKTVDTSVYFRSSVYVKYENWIANVSIGTYSLHELFPSTAPIPGKIVVYAKGEKLSLDLQEDSNYWNNLKVFVKLYNVPIPTPDWNAQEGEAGYIENKPNIDPVVWKYICNPITIREGREAPNDIIEIFTTLSRNCFNPIHTDHLTGTDMCIPDIPDNGGWVFISTQGNGAFVVNIENNKFVFNEY